MTPCIRRTAHGSLAAHPTTGLRAGLGLGLTLGLLVGLWGAPAQAQSQPAVQAQGAAAPASQVQAQNWVSRCQPANQGQLCLAERSYLIVQGEQRQRLLTVRLQRDADGQYALGLLGPLGVRIEPGVALRIGQDEPRRLPYAVCASAGCSAELPLDSATWTRLKTSGQLDVGYVLADGGQATIQAGLDGLAEALKAWPAR